MWINGVVVAFIGEDEPRAGGVRGKHICQRGRHGGRAPLRDQIATGNSKSRAALTLAHGNLRSVDGAS